MAENAGQVELIARVCHEANRAYCTGVGDPSQPAWDEAPDWQRETVMDGVRYLLADPMALPVDSHNNWMREKMRTGWKYGPVKDPEAKTHPCLVAFGALSPEQRKKDYLFHAIVKALR